MGDATHELKLNTKPHARDMQRPLLLRAYNTKRAFDREVRL